MSMIETIFVGFLIYVTIGIFVNFILLLDESDLLMDCGVFTCLLLWPLVLIGQFITGIMKICKVIANEWNRG